MASCANCDKIFKKRADNKGFYRFSLEKCTTSGEPAREALSSLTGANLTPVGSKRQGQFLCPECWSDLNDTVRYKKSLQEFWGKTGPRTYVGAKRKIGSSEQDFIKRPRITSTPLQKSKTAKKLFQPKARNNTKWETIITAIRARQYGRAIRGLFEATKGSKRQFIKIAKEIVRKEVTALLQPETDISLCNDVDIPAIRDFSWDQTLASLQLKAPLLFNVVNGAVTKKSNENSLQSGMNLKPQLGTAVSCLLHARAPRKAAFIQTLFSVQLWRGNLKRDTIDQLSKMGICVSYRRTLGAIDNIRRNFDKTANTCKSEIEVQLRDDLDVSNMTVMWQEDLDVSNAVAVTHPNIEDEINNASDNDDTILDDPEETPGTENDVEELSGDTSSSNSDDEVEDESEGENSIEQNLADEIEASNLQEHEADIADIDEAIDTSVAQAPLQPGFTLCWDNVGKKVVSRHPGVTSSNTYINMALGYMAINRVPSTNLDWQFGEDLKKASDLAHDVFVPNHDDFKAIKSRMTVIVGRIISRHLTWFKNHFSDCASPHIVHAHSAESSHRSVLVNLGVFDVNPSSTQGAISIFETLQQYVPSIRGKPYTTVVYGDGLSCERGNDAHKARANGLNPWERLEGCQPAAQEFHKEMLLLQDYYDLFFKGASAADKGTLCHLKNIFNFRQVKSDISDNFTHAWELMCVLTEGFICLLAMNYLQMEETDSVPYNFSKSVQDSTHDERCEYFKDVCGTVVQKLWHNMNINSLKLDDGTGPPIFCCGEDLDDGTISCTAGSKCENGEVFHYMCADVDPDDLPHDWFCSADCRNRTSVYPYCHCQKDLGNDEPMIGCSAGNVCLGREWYHMKCVDLSADTVPKGEWFCQDGCKTARKKRKGRGKGKSSSAQVDSDSELSDHKYNYTRAITWIGLNLLCRRDAVRRSHDDPLEI